MVSERRRFTLRPLRGLRFDPQTVGDLGTVVSPPYDVLDAETVRELEAANPHNVVRLILSRHSERPYVAVLERLQRWRDRGFLRPDPAAALYLYEYVVGDTTVRGLIGAVGLRDEDERVILPHEDVMPGPVDDRVALMATTETNLEPILLVHEGSSGLRDLLAPVAAGEPVADFVALDGSRHRVWALSDPDTLRAVAEELADAQAVIADGHHRYAAYRRLQRDRRPHHLPDGESAWDYGLALLVDQHDHPLHIGPIHRSVGSLTLADLRELSDERGDTWAAAPDRESALEARARAAGDGDRAWFVVSDGRAWALLGTPRTHQVDAAVLHESLFPAWRVSDEQVGYHHSLDQALATTARQPGVVVAVQPPTVREVMDTASLGVRMPRKSTSFAPKPRMGVVLRDLRDA